MFPQHSLLLLLPFLTPLISAQYGDSPTTTASSSSSSSSTSTSTSTSSSTTHEIDVSNSSGDLTFSPSTLTAATGDTLIFHFYPRNHSVATSSFSSPCQPLSDPDSLFSGFLPSESGKSDMVFTATVASQDPMWLYCSQGRHCQQGMAMVINPPTDNPDRTLDAYLLAAAAVETATSPDGGVSGGEVVSADAADAEEKDEDASSSAMASMSGMSGASSSAAAAAASATGTGAALRLAGPAMAGTGVAALVAGALVMAPAWL